MIIRFFFNTPARAKLSSEPYSVYMEFKYAGVHVKMNTNIKLQYRHFKSTRNPEQLVTTLYQKETKQSRAMKIKEFKKIIANMEEVVSKYEKGFIAHEHLKQVLTNAIDSVAPVENNLMEFFDLFVIEKSKTNIADNTMKVINRSRSLVKEIVEENPGMVFNVFNINVDFFDKLRTHCKGLDFMVSTYNKYLKWIKSMMDWVMDKHPGANVNTYYKKEKELKDLDKDPLYILEDEISILWNREFKEKHLSEHRDMFIFQLLAGQRHSEMEPLGKSLDSIDEEQKIWYASSPKTTKIQKIPLTDISMEIYYRYKAKNKFPVRSNQKRNRTIKNVFESVGLDRSVILSYMFLGDKAPVLKQYALHEVITTHVARATMITHLSKNEAFHVIKQLSGHSNEREMKKYQGSTFDYLKEVIEAKSRELFKKQ